MNHSIENGRLRVEAMAHGAELQSIYDLRAQREYLWQGDSTYWGGRAPNLFPYIGRLTEGAYTYQGKRYEMKIHGVARYEDFILAERTADTMRLELCSSESTRTRYPFDFRLSIVYSLEGASMTCAYVVENTGKDAMYFGVGGHPGINVPPDGNGTFTDWRLRFPNAQNPVRIGVTDSVFLNGDDRPYPLENATDIVLRHDLFDRDAIMLRGSGGAAELYCSSSPFRVRMDYADFANIGIWHKPKTNAPYVCLEPWSSLPSRDGVIEDFASQPDLIRLEAGAMRTFAWTLSFIGE